MMQFRSQLWLLEVDALKAAYPDWYAKSFGDGSPSIFFPVLSPDLKRVFFKMALSTGGDPRSKAASARQRSTVAYCGAR